MRLLELPNEIIDAIFEQVHPADTLALKWTCKSLCERLPYPAVLQLHRCRCIRTKRNFFAMCTADHPPCDESLCVQRTLSTVVKVPEREPYHRSAACYLYVLKFYLVLNMSAIERWPCHDAYRQGYYALPQGKHWAELDKIFQDNVKPRDLYMCSFCPALRPPSSFAVKNILNMSSKGYIGTSKGFTGTSREDIVSSLDLVRRYGHTDDTLDTVFPQIMNLPASFTRRCLACWKSANHFGKGLIQYAVLPNLRTMRYATKPNVYGDRQWNVNYAIVCKRCQCIVTVERESEEHYRRLCDDCLLYRDPKGEHRRGDKFS